MEAVLTKIYIGLKIIGAIAFAVILIAIVASGDRD